MKKKNIIYRIDSRCCFQCFCLTACKEEIDPIVEELDFDRAFTPVGIEG